MNITGFVVLITLIFSSHYEKSVRAQQGLFDSEKKLKILKAFCNGKTDNFCSAQSFHYINIILKLEREKEEITKKLKMEQFRISEFLKKNPRLRFWNQILNERHF